MGECGAFPKQILGQKYCGHGLHPKWPAKYIFGAESESLLDLDLPVQQCNCSTAVVFTISSQPGSQSRSSSDDSIGRSISSPHFNIFYPCPHDT